MARFYNISSSRHWDLWNREFIEVDLGTPSSPNVIKIPVFKDLQQFQFVNQNNNIYCPENYFYLDEYSQTWNNAPNSTTMFIQTCFTVNIYQDIDASTGEITYKRFQLTNSDQVTKVKKALNDFYTTNINLIVISNKQEYVQGSNSSTELMPFTIAQGKETGGTLASTFIRPSDEKLNPTSIENIASGFYPYQTNGVVTTIPPDFWTGELSEFYGREGNKNIPGVLDIDAGLISNNLQIDNEFAGISSSTNKYIAAPRYYEPVDYYGLYVTYGSNTAIDAVYRRVYFGVRPFNYTPT